ncbi:MAG TPA: glycine cleavage T C-terminal barrel domain-containing protein [Actinomycetota bacterium]|nr:glycine cleavage T C-terminal barrel domain-containing protein [Actinomycetota bacterium]
MVEARAREVRRATTLYFGPWYRKTPFTEAAIRHGCTAFDIYNHTYIPSYYDDPVVEYRHLLEHVTLWDVGCERIVEISGPDAHRFTNMLTPRDLDRCGVGQGRYVVLTAPDGGIVNDPVLLRLAEDRYWLALADSDAGLWARGVAVHAGMDVRITEPPVYPVQVQGPRSKDLMRDLFGEWILDLRYYHCREAVLDDIPVVISRTGWTGEVGYEIYLMDPARGDDLWERIMEAGRPHLIRPIAPSEARRIEAGILNYGSDMTIENNPFEVSGLERMVEPGKPSDYIGRGALERIREAGVRRKLVGIEIGGEPLPWELTEFWPAYHDGRRVGHVTDAVWSPRLERNIGYVWVPIELAAPGTPLRVETPEGAVLEARTAAIPFVDPGKRIPTS